MKDPEFIILKNRFLTTFLIIIIFMIPIFFFFKNKLIIQDSEIIKNINNKKSLILYIIEDNCDNCNKHKEYLNNEQIKYTLINRDRDSSYNDILKKIDVSRQDVISPTIIYIENGELVTSLVDIASNEDIAELVENYNLKR